MSSWANQLEADLSWREGELASLKIQVAQAPKGSQKQTALLRAMWAMLYAHYEGFCKFSWDLYLNALESLNVKRDEIVPEICTFSLAQEFSGLKGDMSPNSLWEFCSNKFENLLTQNLEFKTKLETDSNLWPNLFKDNIDKIKLKCDSLETYKTFIKSLVARRNEIAHGKKLVIESLDEYQKYENAALIVMHDLAINIVESLETGAYLKQQPNQN